MVRGPIGRWEGNTPEIGSALNEFEADFCFSIGVCIAKGDAADLLLSGFRILDDDLCEGDGKIQLDERTMSAANDGIFAFRDVDVIGTTGRDLNGNAENALATAPVGHGRQTRGERGDRLRLVGGYDSLGS
jgi:hypothetical protein